MVTPSLMDDYSPWSPDLMNPYLSTPQDSTMDTPLFHYLEDSQMLTGPDCGFLFPMFSEWDVREAVAKPPKTFFPVLDPSSPILHPLLNSFDPFQLSSTPQQPDNTSVVAKHPATHRKVPATGI